MPTALEDEIQLANDLHNLASKEAEIGELENAVIRNAIIHRRLRAKYAAYTFEDREFDDAVDALVDAREKPQ